MEPWQSTICAFLRDWEYVPPSVSVGWHVQNFHFKFKNFLCLKCTLILYIYTQEDDTYNIVTKIQAKQSVFWLFPPNRRPGINIDYFRKFSKSKTFIEASEIMILIKWHNNIISIWWKYMNVQPLFPLSTSDSPLVDDSHNKSRLAKHILSIFKTRLSLLLSVESKQFLHSSPSSAHFLYA